MILGNVWRNGKNGRRRNHRSKKELFYIQQTFQSFFRTMGKGSKILSKKMYAKNVFFNFNEDFLEKFRGDFLENFRNDFLENFKKYFLENCRQDFLKHFRKDFLDNFNISFLENL